MTLISIQYLRLLLILLLHDMYLAERGELIYQHKAGLLQRIFNEYVSI